MPGLADTGADRAVHDQHDHGGVGAENATAGADQTPPRSPSERAGRLPLMAARLAGVEPRVTLLTVADMNGLKTLAHGRGPVSSPEDRFAVLFDRTHQSLLAYAVRRVANPADAADIVAETFLVAWRRLDDVPPDEQARPWLFGVARRVLANYYRGEHRRLALGERLRTSLQEVVQPPEPGDSAVERAMSRLSADDRELLRLVAWEDLARAEIAMVLQVPRATVRVRLHRARRRLLVEMQTMERDSPPGSAQLRRDAVSGHVMSGWAAAHSGAEESR